MSREAQSSGRANFKASTGNFLNFQSDIHCEEDQLGFDKYIETLSKMISEKDFKTPFCIGIYGKWGSGKTSFMRLLEKKLLQDDSEPLAVPVWFNPWRYEKEERLKTRWMKKSLE